MNTIRPIGRTSLSSARAARRKFSVTKIRSGKHCSLAVRAFRRRSSAWSEMCARVKSPSRIAYSVAQRTTEIGVRVALGAQTRDVLQLIVRQGMAPVVSGLVIGIVATFGLGRLIAVQLYQVSAHDPLLLLAAATLLAITALLACLLPARRATHVNPVQALRPEWYERTQTLTS